MGLTWDQSSFTVDSDFLKYFGEQEVDHLLRDAADWSTVHTGALNRHILWLRHARGVDDPSTITNESEHKPAIVAEALRMIFEAATPPGGDDSKAAQYRALVQEMRERIVVETSSGGTQTGRGLPVVVNQFSGTFFPEPLLRGSTKARRLGTSVADTEIEGFDNVVIQGE